MLVWHPPRRLRQVAVIGARCVEVPPGGASLFTISVSQEHGDDGGPPWRLVYRSEAVFDTAHPQWRPLPTDRLRPTAAGGAAQAMVTLRVLNVDQAASALADGTLRRSEFFEEQQRRPTNATQQQEEAGNGRDLGSGSDRGINTVELREEPAVLASYGGGFTSYGETAAAAVEVPTENYFLEQQQQEEQPEDTQDRSPTSENGGDSLEKDWKPQQQPLPSPPSPQSKDSPAVFPPPPPPPAAESKEGEGGVTAEEERDENFLLPCTACVAYTLRFDELLSLGQDLSTSAAAARFLPNTLLFELEGGEYLAHPSPQGEVTEQQRQPQLPRAAATLAAAAAAAAHSLPSKSAANSARTSTAVTPLASSPSKAKAEQRLSTEIAGAETLTETASEAAAAAEGGAGLGGMLIAKLKGSVASLTAGAGGVSGQNDASGEKAAATAAVGHVLVPGARLMPVASLRQQVDTVAALQTRIRGLSSLCFDLQRRVEQLLTAQRPTARRKATLDVCASEERESARQTAVIERRAAATAERAAAAERAALLTSQALVATLQALQAAHRRVTAGEAALDGEEGRGRLAAAMSELVARRCLLTAQVGWTLRLGAAAVRVAHTPPGGHLDEQLEAQWAGNSPGSWHGDEIGEGGAATPPTVEWMPFSSFLGGGGGGDGGRGGTAAAAAAAASSAGSSAMWREELRLGIGGMGLDPSVWRHAFDPGGFEWDPAADKAAAVALGHAALLIDRLAAYLDVPLRYPVRFRGSGSVILDNYGPVGTWHGGLEAAGGSISATPSLLLFGRPAAGGAQEPGSSSIPVEYPLYCLSNRDRPRFAVGVFLLNKDAIQLLQAHGISAAGPSQLLQNLHKLVAAAQAGLPPWLGSSYWRW